MQRNVNQEQRIHNGVKNGSLSNREASHLQGREAHAAHMQARSDTLRQSGRIQRTDNRDSRCICRQKPDGQHRH